jgi:hypothetical protein
MSTFDINGHNFSYFKLEEIRIIVMFYIYKIVTLVIQYIHCYNFISKLHFQLII